MQMYTEHGGDRLGFAEEYGRPPLDFSANVSPLGVPAAVAKAAQQAVLCADAYPDPLCRALRKKIAAARGLRTEWVLCGNGAADLIFRLCGAIRPRRAVVPAPSFAEYEAALRLTDCEVERVQLDPEKGFAPGDELLQAVQPGVDLVFWCQPNNPTGNLAGTEFLLRLARRCAQAGAVLCVDECFLDFLSEEGALTLAAHLAENPNLLILKAFTKMYAMAGLRLGWCECADAALLERMRRAGQPWAVSSVAQAAGLAALDCAEYVGQVRALVARQRPLVEEGLRQLGLRVFPGQANFVLFYTRDAGLGERARKKGLLLRDCSNYPGLGAGWYRTAVRTGPENARMLELLKEAVYEG